jgi:structural hemagglutinin/hemolysin toxin protein RtxA
MYKICFYAPIAAVEQIKNAMFASGAGKIGNYSHFSWQILGEGQFFPLAGSHPAIGVPGKLEKVSEYKVEMVCSKECIHDAIKALLKAHPYEEPAYQVTLLIEIPATSEAH